MGDAITPEAVERLAASYEVPGLPADCRPALTAATLRALARELAEVKAERDAARATNLDLHRRTQEAESRAYKQAGRMKRKVNRVWGWYYTAVDIAKADFHRAIKAESDLATARAQIVAAQDAKPVAWVWFSPDGRIRSASNEAPDDQHIAHATADGDRIIPVYTDPADALAEHDRAVRADERAKCAEVASAETGWDGVPYMSQMQYGPGIGKRIAAAILARGEQEGRDAP